MRSRACNSLSQPGLLYRGTTKMVNMLINVHEGLKRDWDFFLVVVGETGKGKSVFSLELIETWYRVILQKPVTESHLKHITGDIIQWMRNTMAFDDYDLNIYDEGLLSMDSKDHMSKIQKESKKVFNTVRSSKRLFNVIVVQDYFSLTKYFREHRASSVVHIDKRGHYRYIPKEFIRYLNGYNENRRIKSMYTARALHTSKFPDYDGILREPYYDYINKLKQDEIGHSIKVIEDSIQSKRASNVPLYAVIKDDVKRMVAEGKRFREMRETLGVSMSTISKAFNEIKKEDHYDKQNKGKNN